MLQDLAAKPPEVELDMPACSRTASNGGRQKGNGNADQALKCPRCDSSNTKFCYYNNYSLSQPRHFCKNCRRYWTRGGALRNVPVGGGCRKNKRVKQRTVDPSTLLANSLTDGSASTSMLPSMNSGSSLLPNLTGGTSGSSFGDLCSDSHILTIAFSRLQDSLRLGEQSGAVLSSPALFCMGDGSSQTSLLNSNCSQPSHMSNMPTYDNDLVNIGYNGSASVKSEQGAVMYNGSDYSPILFEAPTHITGSATTTLASLEDQNSTFGTPVESFDGTNFVTRSKLQHQKLALQLMNEVQGGADRSNVQLPAFEDETQDRIIRRHNSKVNGRSMSTDWQQEGMTANLLDPPTGDHHNFWSHSWPDMHALAGSATGAML